MKIVFQSNMFLSQMFMIKLFILEQLALVCGFILTKKEHLCDQNHSFVLLCCFCGPQPPQKKKKKKKKKHDHKHAIWYTPVHALCIPGTPVG